MAAGTAKRTLIHAPYRIVAIMWLAANVFACLAGAVHAQRLDELPLDRWAKLRETERYQLQIAERYFREKNYKVALSEYEKYLTLYEESDAAAYSQLKWSLCQVQLRKSNTAIKEGFQSVLDYWPDAPEAVAAAYYIGNTYQGMGRMASAKKAFRGVLSKYPQHLVAAYAAADLGTIAEQEKDEKTQVEMWRRLSFETKRTKASQQLCLKASTQLASYYFSQAAFGEGRQALESSYAPTEVLVDQIVAYLRTPLTQLAGAEETRSQAEKLAAAAIAYLRTQMPSASDDVAKTLARKYWMQIAAIHGFAGHTAETPQVYEQIVKSFGKDDEVLGRLAEWFKTQNRYDEARATYRRYEDQVEGLRQVAYSHRQQSQPDAAVTVYNQLLGVDPENEVRWRSEIGTTYLGFRKFEQAIAVFEQLLSLDAENAEKWRWQIAAAYQQWGKYREAIAHFRQCTNFPENYKQMAACHRQLKEPNEAILLYNQVLAHEPSAPWALLQIGYTREEAGQKEQAIKMFQTVCKRFPKNSYASTAHAHLQNKYKISITLGGGKDE